MNVSKMSDLERLIYAEAIFESVPEELVNLNTYGEKKNGSLAWRSTPLCGTFACVAGWIARHPDMIDAGLGIDDYGSPSYRGFSGIEAMLVFFGISEHDAVFLFGARRTNLPQKAEGLARFRRVISEMQARKVKI